MENGCEILGCVYFIEEKCTYEGDVCIYRQEALVEQPDVSCLTTAVDELNQSIKALNDTLREGFGLWVAGR